jgi:hypothetical protein
MDQNANPFHRYTNLFRDFTEQRAPTVPETNNLVELAREYNRNTRYYNDNIRDYNENIREIINRISNVQTPNRTTPPTFDISMNMSFWEFPLNPPVRGISREQIANNTTTYGYTNEMRESEVDASENICPISLEPFQVGDVICEIRGCGHKFKRPNLMNWFRRNPRCPVCRYDVNADAIPVAEIPNENADLQASLSDMLQSLITNSLDASGNPLYPR